MLGLTVKSLVGTKERTGVTMPKYLVLKMAFDSGYEAGAEDAGSGELLVETLDLRYALYDLDGKTKRAISLDELVMAVSVETLEHEEDCGCGLCRAACRCLGLMPVNTHSGPRHNLDCRRRARAPTIGLRYGLPRYFAR